MRTEGLVLMTEVAGYCTAVKSELLSLHNLSPQSSQTANPTQYYHGEDLSIRRWRIRRQNYQKVNQKACHERKKCRTEDPPALKTRGQAAARRLPYFSANHLHPKIENRFAMYSSLPRHGCQEFSQLAT
jgi:hypothetical protein